MILLIIKILAVGWVVLATAIILNIIALRLGITTWYPFLDEVLKIGFIKAFVQSSFVSKLFLFIIYPLLLGLSAFLIFKRL